MQFATQAHYGCERKYTGDPYVTHLAEVAGIVSTVAYGAGIDPEDMIAAAWLHDCVEDVGITGNALMNQFGAVVGTGVYFLSDMEEGNRTERKAQSRVRLASAPSWVQTIKCADLISNTRSIVLHDPKFAVQYLAEKRALLEVMVLADSRLRDVALEMAGAA